MRFVPLTAKIKRFTLNYLVFIVQMCATKHACEESSYLSHENRVIGRNEFAKKEKKSYKRPKERKTQRRRLPFRTAGFKVNLPRRDSREKPNKNMNKLFALVLLTRQIAYTYALNII